MGYLANNYYNAVNRHPVGYRSGQARGFRYGSLSGVLEQSGGTDFNAMLIAQRNDARQVFGETSIHLPGRTDINYPKLSQAYADRIITYWKGEASRVLSHASDIPGSAVRTQWKAAVARLQALPRMAQTKTILGEALTQQIWDLLDAVVLPMRAIQETPTKFQLMAEALRETIGAGGLTLVDVAIVVGLGYLGLQALKG